MNLVEYMKSDKYKRYTTNRKIYAEDSKGVFFKDVSARIKLELMGSESIVKGNDIFYDSNGEPASYPISCLVVPSSLLASSTSAYISYAVGENTLFDGETNEYLEMKVKNIIKEQSIGGSVLVKKIEDDGKLYINLYNVLSYFVEYDEFIQDKVTSYNIFNKIGENDDFREYILESHKGNRVEYRKVLVDKLTQKRGNRDLIIDGLNTDIDEGGVIYSYEMLPECIVGEVSNVSFNGESDYTADNVSLLGELVMTNTINSQTFDKISNPLLSVPDSALEVDANGEAKINMQDRVIIIGEGSSVPTQIKLESQIEKAQLHKTNIESNIYTSLAVNKAVLGLVDVSQLSGDAIKRMMSSFIARVEEKRSEVKRVLSDLLGIEISFGEVVPLSFSENVASVERAVNSGVMSRERGTTIVSSKDDYAKIVAEHRDSDYQGFGVE